MTDVFVDILGVVEDIQDVAKGIKENDHQASRLSKRVAAIEPRVLAVKQSTMLSSFKSLRQLLVIVEEIRDFLGEFVRTEDIDRALKWKAHDDKFTRLGVNLTERMEALQRDVVVDAWAKEDASDRLKDIETMMSTVEQMERHRKDNHAKVTGKRAKVTRALEVSLKSRVPQRLCRDHHT